MRVSTKGRYGIKAMVDLAGGHGQGPMSLNMIAQRQELSEAYLEQLFGALRKAELVKSIRGAQGGYILAAAPEQITVGQILRALESTIAPADCLEDGDMACGKAESCVSRVLWSRIQQSINAVIDHTTLADMLNEQDKLDVSGDDI